MRISIIIPTYYAQKGYYQTPIHLWNCLESIAHSTHTPHEIIVIDDYSDVAYAHQLSSHIIFHKMKMNGGPAKARNIGASIASGDILCFIDSDVMLLPKTLEKILKTMNNPEVDIVQGIYSTTCRVRNFASQYQNLYQHYIFNNIRTNKLSSVSSYCLAIRRSVFNELGGFNDSVHIASVEDGDFGLDAHRQGKRILLNREAEVEHLAHFTNKKILKRTFSIATTKMQTLRFHKERLKTNPNTTHHSIGKLLSMAIAPCIILSPIAFIWNTTFSLAFAAGILFLFLILNMNFFMMLKEHKGLRFLAKAIPFHFINMATGGFGVLYGILAPNTTIER